MGRKQMIDYLLNSYFFSGIRDWTGFETQDLEYFYQRAKERNDQITTNK